jgi:hypothetical protein
MWLRATSEGRVRREHVIVSDMETMMPAGFQMLTGVAATARTGFALRLRAQSRM